MNCLEQLKYDYEQASKEMRRTMDEIAYKLDKLEDRIEHNIAEAEALKTKDLWESRIEELELITKKGLMSDEYDFIFDKANKYTICLDCWLQIVGDWRPDWADDNTKVTPVYDGELDSIGFRFSVNESIPFSFQTKEQCKLFISRAGKQFKELTQ